MKKTKTTGKKTTGRKPKKGNGKPSRIDINAYTEMANKSSKGFIAAMVLGMDEIAGMDMDAKGAQEHYHSILDKMLDAFVTAQSDAIKLAFAQVADAVGLPPFYTLRKEDEDDSDSK